MSDDMSHEVGVLTKGQQVLEQRVIDLEDDREETRKVLCAVAAQLESVPNDTHKDHHALMERMIKKEALREEFWRDVKLYMVKKGVWWALAVIGTASIVIWNNDLALKMVYKIFNLKGK